MRFGLKMFVLAAAAVVAVPGTAAAGDDRPERLLNGTCSAGSSWKLDLKERDGGLEVEFEVDENRNGSTWTYTIFRGTSTVGSGSAVTVAPSGSFSVERNIAGASIDADITARAENAASGETCATTGAPSPGGGGDDNGSGSSSSGGDDSGSSSGGDDNGSTSGSGSSSGTVKRTTGSCSGSSDWKLKTKRRDGRVEVEFEVDSNKAGQRWSYRMKKGTKVVGKGKARTAGRSGSFSVEKKVSKSGNKKITAKAKNLGNGETCRAAIRF